MNKNLLIVALLTVSASHAVFGKCKGRVCRPKARKATKTKRNPVRACVSGVSVKATKAAAKTTKKAVKATTPSCRSCRK